ncbi:MAG: protease complex subunit PrcB family protein [Opitutae bacterium]|nr:protease complex subunit PrcB family protein [Opitutae bacterium]
MKTSPFVGLLLVLLLGSVGAAEPAKPAAETTLTGLIERRVATGGETTGWILRYDKDSRVDLLLPYEAFAWLREGIAVAVTGKFETRHYPERGEVRVFVVREISEIVASAIPAPEAPPAFAPVQQWSANLAGMSGEAGEAWRIDSEARWRELWQRELNREPPPAPDFTRHCVMVVGSGRQPTGGYHVEVMRVVLEAKVWVVEYRVHRPDRQAFVTMALTYPVAVAVFPRLEPYGRPAGRDVTPPDDTSGASPAPAR